MIELTILAIAGVTLFVVVLSLALFALIAVLLKAVVWLVFLPLRIAFALLVLPLLLIKTVFAGLLFLIVGPLFAVASIVAAVVIAAALALPLAPLLLLLFAIWMLTRPRPDLVRS